MSLFKQLVEFVFDAIPWLLKFLFGWIG